MRKILAPFLADPIPILSSQARFARRAGLRPIPPDRDGRVWKLNANVSLGEQSRNSNTILSEQTIFAETHLSRRAFA